MRPAVLPNMRRRHMPPKRAYVSYVISAVLCFQVVCSIPSEELLSPCVAYVRQGKHLTAILVPPPVVVLTQIRSNVNSYAI